MIRLFPVAALTLALGTLLPVPSYAAGETCDATGFPVVIVTAPGGGVVWLGTNPDGRLAVAIGDEPRTGCAGQTDVETAGADITVSASGGGTTWVVSTELAATATIRLENLASDSLVVEGTEEADYWRASAPLGLSLDLTSGVDPAAELTLAGPVAKATFLPDEGNDFLDLSGWSLPASVDPGEESDAVTGTAVNDSFVIAPDGEPDTIDAGPGYDSLVFDAEEDEPVRYDEDPNVSDGIVGEEDDDLNEFEVVTGGRGGDTLAAGDSLHDVRGGPGNDILISGAGNDLLTGGPGFDFMAFRRLGAVVVSGAQATGQGTDTFGDGRAEGVEGSRYADRFRISAAGAIVKPGRGNDRLVATAPGVRLLADDRKDGSDTFKAPRGNGVWDYSLRTAPVRVSAARNGAVDGEPGEEDNVAVRAVIGGRSNDVLTGSTKGNQLQGGPGSDSISAGGGKDKVDGGPGADVISGGGGRDVLQGGSEADRIDSRDGQKDTVLGGGGRDLARRDSRDRVRQVEGAY